MREIELTQGKVSLVDDEDFELLNQYKWCWDTGYAVRRVKGKKVTMHRFIMGNPIGMEIDHKNSDKLDNRKENLRICTHSMNVTNRSINKNNSSGYKGVYWHKGIGRWIARIGVNSKKINLGVFDNPEDAAKVYDTAAIKFHGEFANINFK